MSLLDLNSDLSKFRYNAPKPTTTLPKNRQSQNNYDNNFGTYKPITDGLIDNRPGVVEPKNINLPDKLKDTRLDDTVKKVFQESLINSVSEYSPKNIESNFGSPSRVSLESIVSAFSRINTDVVQSSIDKSNIQITKTQQGTNNNDSDIEIIDNGSEVGNITNPNITLNNIPLTYERERQSADISVNPDDAKDNIKNPDVTLNNIPLTFNRELESVDLEKGFSLREFIVDANSNKLLSDSILNIDRTPEKYRTQSRIENREIPEKVDTSRYNGQISDLAISDSFLDLTNPEQTVLSGRHESDRNSSLSNSKDNLVDYFGNENADGFTKKVEPLKTEYVNNSSNLGYETILEANYFDITNQYTTDGFEAFATEYDSKYKLDASRFDWDGTNAPVVNYFDVNNQFTKNGFTSFAEKFRTEYKTESSEFDWDGIRQNAPKVNYFDLTGANTKEGFHTFAIEYDSKYVHGSSRYDWDGERNDAPEVNYFDTILRHTSKGFHKFAFTKEPTTYTNDGVSLLSGGPGVGTSDFDWDGTSANAPTNDQFNPNGYFDQTNRFTTQGFHTFAQIKDTKYIPESSEFDWDGLRNQAPTNDFLNPNGYFDQNNQFTTQGFHTFAQIYDTKYIPESSQFDWDGLRSQAPTNDANNPNGYFDQNNRFTFRGFHTFASTLEATSYTNTSPGQPVTAGGVFLLGGGLGAGSSDFDWDGGGAQFNSTTSQVAPAVNYFDANGRFTFRGFHIFARTLEATSYTNTNQGQPVTSGGVFLLGGGIGVGTSDLDWDGNGSQFSATTSQVAPAVNYFDANGRFTYRGFHIQARPLEPTSYTNTNQGQPINSGGVFLLGGALGAGSSDFDWDGNGSQFSATTSQIAPAVNYFDVNNRFTYRGFHIFARTLEPTSYTNTNQGQPITAGGVFLLGGGLGAGSSDFDWDGDGQQFSSATSQVAPAVNYFDLNNRATYRGFHIFARTLEPTSYTNTNQGQPVTAGGVFLLGGGIGAGSSDLDWDGDGQQFSANTTQVAPAVNYFDLNNRATYRGFHIFARTLEPTSYTNTNQGQPITAGGVFLLGGALGAGSSDLDWDGDGQQFSATTSQVAPAVNYFDANGRFTYRGFHIQARPLEPTSYTNNNRNQPVIGPGTFLLGGTLGAGSSDLDWDGNGSQFSATTSQVAPAVNYFDPNNRFTFRGFHIQARPLEPTSYTNTNQNQPITAGGVSLIGGGVGVGTSDFDWDGTDPYSMGATRFFGFNQTSRFGFMVNMSQFDGTAYPIITPQFDPNILGLQGLPQRSQRSALSTLRQSLEPLQTTNLEQFAPLSFGGKSISGFKATIDNQSPVVNVQKYGFNITGYRRRGKTVGQLVDQTSASTFVINPSRVLPFMDVNRYTLGGGVDTQPTFVDGQMAIWANSGDVNAAFQTFTTTGTPVLTAAEVVALNRSFNGLPYYNGVLYKSHIDYQYSKYNLVKDSFNTSTTYPQPFVDTSLNGEDRDIFASLRSVAGLPNSVSIPGAGTVNLSGIKSTINDAINFIDRAQSFDDGIVRGGVVKNTIRALLDTKRITKFLLSPKGLLWNAKQVGLQFMNPRVDTGTGLFDGVLGLNWTNIYNPLSVPLNVAGRAGVLGLRLARHGVLMTGEGAYEDIAVDRSNNSNDRNFSSFSSPSFFNRTSDYNRLVSLTKELLPDSYKPILLSGKMPTPSTSTEIERLSTSFGGPGSFLGLFGTTINRSTHPYKGINSTGYFPKEEDIRDGLDREVFWGSTEDDVANNKYSQFLIENSVESIGGYGEPGFSGIILALMDYARYYPKYGQTSRSARIEQISREPDTPYGVQKITARRLLSSGFEQFKHPSPRERIRNTSRETISSYRSRSEFLSKNNVEDDNIPIKNYSVGGYEDLTMDIEARDFTTDTIKLRDFRSSIEGNNNSRNFNSSPKIINFAKNNIDTRFGFGQAGDPGNDRSQVYVSTVQYSSLLPQQASSDPTAVTTENVLANYKYAAYPKQKDTVVVSEYDKTTRTTSTRTTPVPKFRGDRINIIDWKRSTTDLSAPFVYERERNSQQSSLDALGGAEDLIQFYFTGARLKGSEFNPTEALVFRAYIDTIVDNHKPSWSPIKYIGRADPVYSYDGYERDINFGFTVHIGSRDEMKASWRKLNMLASWTAPEYTTNGFMRAPVIRLNLGNLYRKFPGFLSSLSYTFDNTQTTWETAKLKEDQNFKDELTKKLSMPGVLELPKTINVQCTFVTFNMYRPEWDCVFYSLFDDETGPNSVETGLAPMHDDRVNYFRTFDDLPVGHTMNSGLCAIIDQSEPPKKPVEKTPDTKPPVEEQRKPKTKCLCPIEFCVDEDRYVKADSEKAIEELANWLKSECDCAKIKLIGHANNGNKYSITSSGDKERRDRMYNIALSRSRARTVKGILVDQYGIDETRIVTDGVGYTKPISGIPVDSPKNIRIEVVIENQEEASTCTQISLDCKDNTKCGTLAPCNRKDQGDKSQFWLVGPQYFTYKFVEDTGIGGAGPISNELKAISEQVDGDWWVPIVSPFGPIEYAPSWRTQNAGRGYRVKGYGLKRNQSGWSDINSRYDTNGGTVSAYLPNPDHVGPIQKEELE